MILRQIYLLALLALLIGTGYGQSFQVRGVGSPLSIMQSGNPGSSASFALNSGLRIEPNESIVTTVALAPLPPVPVVPISAGGSATQNHIVEVCDLETDKCVSVFPKGRDDIYTAYQNCLSQAGSVALDCAEDWAVSKGYLPYEQYLALKNAENEPLLAETSESDNFKTSAPEEVPTTENEPTFDIGDNLKTNLIFDLEKGEAIVEEPAVPEAVVSVPEVSTENITFDLESGEVVAPSQAPLRAAAPVEVVEEILLPREPDASVEREHYTCLKVPSFVAHNDVWRWLAYRLFFVLVMLVIIIFLLAFWVFLIWNRSQPKTFKRFGNSVMNKMKKWFVIGLLATIGLAGMVQAQAVVTTPQLLIYEGELLDNTGAPLPGDFTFRFSFWLNADFENADVAAGNLNTAAIDFLGWQEVQGQVLDAEGRFSFQLGTVTPFTPDIFDQDDLYLQVEVRNTADPDTAYEVIDVDVTDITVDRKVIASVPFAFNANNLDFRSTGSGPGNIPFLDDITGLLPQNIFPDVSSSGADDNIFTIDQDGDAATTDTLTLQFGDAIAESLAWNGITDQFEFSDDVNIAGDLTVTGTINGVTLGPQNVADTLSPRYPNSIFEADGTLNSGEMHEEQEIVFGGAERQVLRWTTDLTSQQDYDILIRYTLPENFSQWLTPSLSLDYIAPSNVGDSQIDLRVFQDGSTVDQLSGTALDLSSNAWVNDSFNLNAATVWNPGDVVQIELKMHSRNFVDPRVADIVLNYVVE